MSCCHSLASSIDKIPRVSRATPSSTYASQWVTLERSTIRYIKVGNPQAKETVILMPDPPNTIEHMSELISLLEADFQVIAFEGAGFGYSTAAMSFDFSIEDNANVIIELLTKLQVNQAILALTCVAALPGLMVAQKHPELVSGLVLGQTPSLEEAKRWAKKVDFKGILGTPFIGQLVLKMMKRRIADIWYKYALPKNADRQTYLTKTLSSFKRGAKFPLASAFQSLQRDKTPLSALVAKQKAIVVWGDLDRSHKKTNKRLTLELVPNGKLIELKGCAHFPDIEAPLEFAKAIFEVSKTSQP